MDRRKRKFIRYEIQADNSHALDNILYELKPYVLLGAALATLNSSWASALPIKYISLSIFAFGTYIAYCRLTERGYL